MSIILTGLVPSVRALVIVLTVNYTPLVSLANPTTTAMNSGTASTVTMVRTVNANSVSDRIKSITIKSVTIRIFIILWLLQDILVLAACTYKERLLHNQDIVKSAQRCCES